MQNVKIFMETVNISMKISLRIYLNYTFKDVATLNINSVCVFVCVCELLDD